MTRSRGHFAHTHPLAHMVRLSCMPEHRASQILLGAVGCGPCWETVLRADERIAVECGLGELPEPEDHPKAPPTGRTTAMRATKGVLMSKATTHLGVSHRLADTVQTLCRARGHRGHKVGAIACGACWETVIRADERAITEANLATGTEAEPPSGPVLVTRTDEPMGLRQRLDFVREMSAAGLTVREMRSRCRFNAETLYALLTLLEQEADRYADTG